MTQPDPSLDLVDQDLAPDDDTALTQAGCAATRDLVFVAAEHLFAVHGFQKVSVRDITAEAKVNLASINYHFGSRTPFCSKSSLGGRRSSTAPALRCYMRLMPPMPASRRFARSFTP